MFWWKDEAARRAGWRGTRIVTSECMCPAAGRSRGTMLRVRVGSVTEDGDAVAVTSLPPIQAARHH